MLPASELRPAHVQTLLTEMARIRAHGFSEREVTIARSKLMSDIEGGSGSGSGSRRPLVCTSASSIDQRGEELCNTLPTLVECLLVPY